MEGQRDVVVRVGVLGELALVEILQQVAVADLFQVSLEDEVVGEELRILEREPVTILADGQPREGGAVEVGFAVLQEEGKEGGTLLVADLAGKRLARGRVTEAGRRRWCWCRRKLLPLVRTFCAAVLSPVAAALFGRGVLVADEGGLARIVVAGVGGDGAVAVGRLFLALVGLVVDRHPAARAALRTVIQTRQTRDVIGDGEGQSGEEVFAVAARIPGRELVAALGVEGLEEIREIKHRRRADVERRADVDDAVVRVDAHAFGAQVKVRLGIFIGGETRAAQVVLQPLSG